GTTVAPGEARQVEGHRLWQINNIDRLQTAREEGLDRLLGSVGRDVIIHNTSTNASSYDDYRDRLTVTYEELTRPVSLTTRLSRVCYSQTFAATFVAGLGFFVAIFTIAQGSVITGNYVNVNLVILIQY